jgi:saccharopine dehydrogenase (NAD+, L-lysine-forming)
MFKTIMILGGYGNAGRPIASLLLKEAPDFDIVIAGRNLAAAQEYANKLNENYERNRAQARQVDASSSDSLDTAFCDIDMVVVASSTNQYTPLVVEAALKANIDYFDIQVTPTKAIESLQHRISTSTKCFVTQGGFHPGMPAALVQYASTQLNHVQKANVYCNMSLNWKELNFSDTTKEEFYRELFDMKNDVYVNGKWEAQGWSVVKEYDFGEPFSKKTCVPMFLEEMQELPRTIPSLEETGMYISGFDNVTNFVTMPIGMLANAICPRLATRPMSNLFVWSLKTFCKPPFGAVVVVEAEDASKEQSDSGGEAPAKLRLSVSHEDAYVLTAVPVVACLLQLLDGGTKPGLHYQANIVEPKRFLSDLESLGLNVSIEKVEANESK